MQFKDDWTAAVSPGMSQGQSKNSDDFIALTQSVIILGLTLRLRADSPDFTDKRIPVREIKKSVLNLLTGLLFSPKKLFFFCPHLSASNRNPAAPPSRNDAV